MFADWKLLSSALGLAMATLLASTVETRAAYIVMMAEVGPDVVMTGSGTVNIAGLSRITPNNDHDTGYMYASAAYLGIGPTASTPVDKYTGAISGPAAFGTTGQRLPTSGSGDMVFLAKVANIIDVPTGYVSGNPLGGTITFANQSFSSLGITPGTYTWTWGSGATADSFTLTNVPEPATLGAALLGLAMLAMRQRIRD